MNGIGTVTQKGQVAIPIAIRRHFNLKPQTKVYFQVKGENIVASPIWTSEQAYGIFAGRRKRPLTKGQMKAAIRKAVIEKFRKKLHDLH